MIAVEQIGRKMEAALEAVRARTRAMPRVGILVTGGLAMPRLDLSNAEVIGWSEIPNLPPPRPEVERPGLTLGTVGEVPVAVLSAAAGMESGVSPGASTLPVRLFQAMEIELLLLAGPGNGLHPLWQDRDLVLHSDHINLLGDNPLVGYNDEALGPRFPDLSEPYDRELRTLARDVAAEHGIALREGVYAAVTGPGEPTRAEARMLRSLGADLVGHTIVPEVIVANHAGMRALAVTVLDRSLLPDDPLAPGQPGPAPADTAGTDLAHLLSRLVERLP